MKASIDGTVNCYCEGDVSECSKILDRFGINHSKDGTEIKINGMIKVTPWFDRSGFENMLSRKIRPLGKITLQISH